MANQNGQANELAIVKRDTVDVVAERIRAFHESGELHCPANYSPENAMKSAWLALQEVKDMNKKPALEVCTKNSIANSLLDMVVQGLNPAKKQCYFIVYGKDLVCQRSYLGTMAVAKSVDSTIDDIYAEVVYEGDTFKYSIERGKKVVTKHEQSIENVDKKKIVAAYCVVIDKNGEIKRTDIMTIDEIKQAWKQSKMNPVDDKGNVKAASTHGKFAAEMAKKTVINRTCKPIINSSDDSGLLMKHYNRTDEVIAEVEVEEEIAENANREVIDIEPDPGAKELPEAEESEPEEEPEPARKPGF